MERPIFQESGDEDLDEWQWACSTNQVVSEEKVKGVLKVSRLGDIWQVVPVTEAANMGQILGGGMNVMFPS